MNKYTIFAISLFAICAFFSCTASAQPPKINVGGIRTLVVTDDNFEPQKFKPALSIRPGIAYEVWITTDAVLHCKTASNLTTASIEFMPPKVTTQQPGGYSTSSGGGYSRKVELNKTNGEYQFSLTKDKYREKHAIVLSIVSTSGAKADIKLVNKKVPAEINK